MPALIRRSLWDLAAAIGVPTSLAELGLERTIWPRRPAGAGEITDNPGPVGETDLLALLERAMPGIGPSTSNHPHHTRGKQMSNQPIATNT